MDVLCEPLSEEEAKAIGVELFKFTILKAADAYKADTGHLLPLDLGLVTRIFYAEDAWYGDGPNFSAVTVWAERKAASGTMSVRVDGFLPGSPDPAKVYQAFMQALRRESMFKWQADAFDPASGWIDLRTNGLGGGINSYPEAVFCLLTVFVPFSTESDLFNMMPWVKGLRLELVNSAGVVVGKIYGNRRAHRFLQDEYYRRYSERAAISDEESALAQRRAAGAITKQEYEEQLFYAGLQRYQCDLSVWVAASSHFQYKWFSDDLAREVPDNLY
jgi:hypothetical protein